VDELAFSAKRRLLRKMAALVLAASFLGPGLPAQADSHDPVPQPTVTPTPDPTPTEDPPPPAPPPPQFPALPAGSGDGRRVVYSNSRQRVWLVESGGNVVDSYLVSGRKGMPRPGTYKVFSKSRHSRAGKVRMEYMTRFARGRRLAIGFHSIPVDRRGRPIQTESELGQYRSHGCVRQRMADAITLWNFAPVGTKVVVTS